MSEETAGSSGHGATSQVSVDSARGQANIRRGGPALRAEGRVVAFWSDASNLVPRDTCDGDFSNDDSVNPFDSLTRS